MGKEVLFSVWLDQASVAKIDGIMPAITPYGITQGVFHHGLHVSVAVTAPLNDQQRETFQRVIEKELPTLFPAMLTHEVQMLERNNEAVITVSDQVAEAGFAHIRKQLAAAGIDLINKNFHPHITIGKITNPAQFVPIQLQQEPITFSHSNIQSRAPGSRWAEDVHYSNTPAPLPPISWVRRVSLDSTPVLVPEPYDVRKGAQGFNLCYFYTSCQARQFADYMATLGVTNPHGEPKKPVQGPHGIFLRLTDEEYGKFIAEAPGNVRASHASNAPAPQAGHASQVADGRLRGGKQGCCIVM